MALSFAASLHRDQSRKASDVPYVAHLLAVASIVLEHGGGEDEAIAALLHDAIEDQGGYAHRGEDPQPVWRRSSRDCGRMQRTQVTPRPAWLERKQSHLAHVGVAPPAVKLVVAAENCTTAARSPGNIAARERRWSHFRGGKAGTLWFAVQALAAVVDKIPAGLATELELAVAELEKLASA